MSDLNNEKLNENINDKKLSKNNLILNNNETKENEENISQNNYIELDKQNNYNDKTSFEAIDDKSENIISASNANNSVKSGENNNKSELINSENNDLNSNLSKDNSDENQKKMSFKIKNNLIIDWFIDKLLGYSYINGKNDSKLSFTILDGIKQYIDSPSQNELYILRNNNELKIYYSSDMIKQNKNNNDLDFVYFLKKDYLVTNNDNKKTTNYNENLSSSNIENIISCDHIHGNIKKKLIDVMNNKYIPNILSNIKLPEGIKKDLISNTHKFMINLFNVYYSEQNKIVLYIPKEKLTENFDILVKDKDLISRLDLVMIEWTNQIRDFLSIQESVSNRDEEDVLNEINFWETRSMNLCNISDQLENENLNLIVSLLTKASSQSENVTNFNTYKHNIMKEKKTAQEILKFIKILCPDCIKLTNSEIKDIPAHLTTLLDKIRIITEFCRYYKKKEKASELIKKVSIQLIKSFTYRIKSNFNYIKEKYSEDLHNDIKLIKKCIIEWKIKFEQSMKRVEMFELKESVKRTWSFDHNDIQNIFYEIESFEKRCDNLEDICLCQLQFGKKKETRLPIFGGTKYYEIEKQLLDIEKKFDDLMYKLIQPNVQVTDIKEGRWTEEFRSFSKSIEDLEDMYKNTILSSFKRVVTIEEYVNYIENFYSLAQLNKIKNFIKVEIVYEFFVMFIKEIEKMKLKNDNKMFVKCLRRTNEGDNLAWSKFLLAKLEEYQKCLSKLNQIFEPKLNPKEEQQHQKTSKYNELKTQIVYMENILKIQTMQTGGFKDELSTLSKVNDQYLDDKLKAPLIKPFFINEDVIIGDMSLYQCNYPVDLLKLYAYNNVYSRFEEFSISPDIIKKIQEKEEKTRQLRETVLKTIRDFNNLVHSIKDNTEQTIFQEEFNKLKVEGINKVTSNAWNSRSNENYLNKFKKLIVEVQAKINDFKENNNKIYAICDQISKISYFKLERNNDIYDITRFEEEQNKLREKTAIFIKTKANEILDLINNSYSFIKHLEGKEEVYKGFKIYIEDISEKYFNESLDKALIYSINSMHKAMLGNKTTNPPPFLKISIKMIKSSNNEKYYNNAVNNKYNSESNNVSIGHYKCEPTSDTLRKKIDKIIDSIQQHVINSPNIFDMFAQKNEDFIKKTEKKATISQNTIVETEHNIQPKQNKINLKEEKKKNLSSINKSTKYDVSKDKKGDTLNNNNYNAININNINEKEEKGKTSKFETAKRSFINQYSQHKFGEHFDEKIKLWKDCKSIKEKKSYLNIADIIEEIEDTFNRFLVEPNSKENELHSELSHIVYGPIHFKTELTGGDTETSIPETISTYFFIQFDSTEIKQKLVNLCENNYNKSLEYLKNRTKEELIDKVELDFKNHEIEFKNEPETKEEYRIMVEKYNRCEKEKNLRFKKILAADFLVSKLFQANKNTSSSDELVEKVNSLAEKRTRYEQLLLNTKDMIMRAKEKLVNSVKKDLKNFRTNLEEMRKEFELKVPNKIEGKLSKEIEATNAAKNRLEEFENKVKELKEEEKTIKKGFDLFKDDLPPYTEKETYELFIVEEQIKTLKIVWNIKAQMNEVIKKWYSTQFYSFDLKEMMKERNELEKQLHDKCKNCNQYPIFCTMINQLNLYKENIEILESLRQPFMNDKFHWNKLAEAVKDPKIDRFNLTFEQVLEFKLDTIRDSINDIVEYANYQEQVNLSIQEMQNIWKNYELKYKVSRLGDFSLDYDPKLIKNLEDHLNKIANHKATPYYKNYKEEIDELESDLNKISDVYSLLKNVIVKWQYLKNFFSKNKEDMGQQAGQEEAQFKKDNESFEVIYNMFISTKFIKKCFTKKDYDVEFKLNKLMNSFINIERALFKLLDSKRNNFERLHFLSNEDFLELLGKSSDEKAINYHLSKLFSGIDTIKISGSKEKVVQYVTDSLGEKFSIWFEGDPSIKVTSLIETWMKNLEIGMIETLERNFTYYYIQCKNNKNFSININDGIDNVFKDITISSNPVSKIEVNSQMVLLMAQNSWYREIESGFNSSTGIKYDNIINELRIKTKEVIEYLKSVKKRSIVNDIKTLNNKNDMNNPKNRVFIYNYILIINNLIDQTEMLRDLGVKSSENYEWKKILKMVFKPKVLDKKKNKITNEERYQIVAEQLENSVNYGYEYIGNKERLVITPLTERCFLTMMTALFYNRGGMLQGPAGTGKTETIKDLSRQLAKFIIVFNCSSKNSYNTMATIFMGMLKTGAWCCFDEFNRIEIEVLSVVRIQLSSIYDGLKSVAGDPNKKPTIGFKQTYVEVNREVAVFITLNPTYTGRTELPENLKTLFRPISVAMADKVKICKIRFTAEAYPNAEDLAKKLTTFYDVMEQQLSYQPHYDFSLRSMTSVLNYTIYYKSKNDIPENQALKTSISNVIRPKLVSLDEAIFDAILDSVFSDNKNDISPDDQEELVLHKGLKIQIEKLDLCGSPYVITMCTQLISNLKFKHGIMLIGESLSGKSTCLEVIKSLNKNFLDGTNIKDLKDIEQFLYEISSITIFPKALELDDLYGKLIRTREEVRYTEGLLPYHLKELSNVESKQSQDKTNKKLHYKWLILDGSIDSLWVETLNTVLDETKMLSLPSGYRVNVKNDIKLIFEAENLTQATPATVSRVGLVYFESEKLSFFPIARNWLDKKKLKDRNWDDYIAKWFDRYVYNIFLDLENAKIKFIFKYSYNHIIISLINIFDAFVVDLDYLYKHSEDTRDKFWDYAERLFIFSLIWAIGGGLSEEGRIQFDTIIKKYYSNMPQQGLAFNYFVNPDKDEWSSWEDKILKFTATSSILNYNDIFIPTLETTRVKAIVNYLIKIEKQPIIFGEAATGKSNLIKMIFKSVDSTEYYNFTVQLSYGVKPKTLQSIVESNFEKRNNKLFPPNNKTSLCCIEDLNLPKKDHAKCQNVNELIRQYRKMEGWHDAEKLSLTQIKSMQILCTSSLRERNSDINQRIVTNFIPFNLSPNNDESKFKIFQSILNVYLSKIANEDIKKLSDYLSTATIELFNMIAMNDNLTPTHYKSHYTFNMRDISKIFEALSKVKTEGYQGREYFIKLWTHESFRTINDKLLNDTDKDNFRQIISKQLDTLGSSLKECQGKDERLCMFVDFMNDDAYYDEVVEFSELKSKIINTPIASSETMVYFDQAIEYICILNRIVNKSYGGHGLLIGTGANGRSIYLNIAAILSGFTLKKLVLKDSYDKLHETIENEVINIGKSAVKTCILIRDSDITSEQVMENLNYLITTGFIPTLKIDIEENNNDSDFQENRSNDKIKDEDEIYNYNQFLVDFKNNVKNNLKIFLSYSPLGSDLKNVVRDYPGIISHTTAVYFNDWPLEALKEVAKTFLDIKIINNNNKFNNNNNQTDNISNANNNTTNSKNKTEDNIEYYNEETDAIVDVSEIFSDIHLSVRHVLDKMDKEIKRKAYFTSNNFMNLIYLFNRNLKLKQDYYENNINKYIHGLEKIKLGKIKIDEMSIELVEKNKEESEKQSEIERILERIKEEKKLADEQDSLVASEKIRVAKEEKDNQKNIIELKKEMALVEKPMNDAITICDTELTRNRLLELKKISHAGQAVKDVFFALCAFWDKKVSWEEAKVFVTELAIEKLSNLNELPITESVLDNKISVYTNAFKDEKELERTNTTVASIAKYILAVQKYFTSKWNLEIKQKKFNEASKKYLEAKEKLSKLEADKAEIDEKLYKLEKERETRESLLDSIKKEGELIKEMLIRANSLTEAFKSEEERWKDQLSMFRNLQKIVIGNTILASSMLNYFGVFTKKYREELYNNYLIPILKNKRGKFLPNEFNFFEFISNSREIQDWIIDELPNDQTSKENAVIIKYGYSFPLIIDPQDQAYNWLMSMYKDNLLGNQDNLVLRKRKSAFNDKNLITLTPDINNYCKTIEKNITNSNIILNNLGESLDIELEDFLKRTKYSNDFNSLYLMTKIPNPHYFPKVSNNTNIINFLVNEKGLEEQLLSITIKYEKEDVDEKINANIRSIYEAKLKLESSEQEILDNLNNANDNYLEDDTLIKKLNSLKDNSTKQKLDLKQVGSDMEKLLNSYEEYRPLAKKASRIFFVLYSLNTVNKMYEFSLKSYISLFIASLNKDKNRTSNESSETRIKLIYSNHLQKIIQYANQGLFENHRLLFSLQLCITHILAEEEEQRKMDELYGVSKRISKENQDLFSMDEFKLLIYDEEENIDPELHKPNWITDNKAWKSIFNIESKIPDFKGIVNSFTLNSSDWNKWYERKDIENEPLPIDWDAKCKGYKNLRKLLFIKALRPDKFTTALKNYINLNLKVETKETNIDFKQIILYDMEPYKPLLIIHGNGVDPSETLKKLWNSDDVKKKEDNKTNEANNNLNNVNNSSNISPYNKHIDKKDHKKKEKKFFLSTLNEDQLYFTINEIEDIAKIGGWVYLANTHLTLKSIPELEKKLGDLGKNVHKDFRLIISTSPTESYPISFLQKCDKIVYENPKGIRTNISRLLSDLIKENSKDESIKHERPDIKLNYLSKLIFSLCMFHSIVTERRKYKSFGWSTFYDFNYADFSICYDIIKSYVKKSTANVHDLPYKAIQELICINYGSRFTNDKDMILLNTYCREFFKSKVLIDKNYVYAQNENSVYSIPDESNYEKYKNQVASDVTMQNKSELFMKLSFYHSELDKMPRDDSPEIFGLHYNAEIMSQIQDNYQLISNIKAMSSDIISANSSISTNKNEIILKKIKEILGEFPPNLNEESAMKKSFLPSNDKNKKANFDALNYILVQETIKYNLLLKEIKQDLTGLDEALKGSSFISSKNEEIYNCIYLDKVPSNWQKFYLSTKPFGLYIKDLRLRIKFFTDLIDSYIDNPKYKLGYFTNPYGFITAIKQAYALSTGKEFYKLSIDFKVIDEDKTNPGIIPNKGNKGDQYAIQGLYIEGGSWDKKSSSLKEENIQELTNPLPTILMIPCIDSLSDNQGYANINTAINIHSNPYKGVFPVYYIPIRDTFMNRPTYVMDIVLPLYREKDKDGNDKSPDAIADFWIKKGTCVLLNKSD